MATVENFILKFKVDGDQAIKSVSGSIQNLSRDVSALSTGSLSLSNSLSGIVSKLGPIGLAASAAGAAFGALGGKALQLADALGDISAATGISAGSLLNFKQSLVQAGGGIDTYARMASKLSITIGEAARGNAEFKDSFRALGVNTVDAMGNLRNSNDILQETIAALGAIEDPAKRARLGAKLLGEEAAKIDWTKVNAGKDAITDEQVEQLNKYNDALKELRATLEKKVLSFFGQLAVDINNALTGSEKLEASIRRNIKATQDYQASSEFSGMPGFGETAAAGTSGLILAPSKAGGGRGFVNPPTVAASTGAAGNIAEDALIASNKRIQDATSQYTLQKALQTRDERIKIEANLAEQIRSIQADVAANKSLSGPEGAAQREAEITARTTAARERAATEIYNLESRIADQILQSKLQHKQLVMSYTTANIEAANQLTIQTRSIGLGEKELELYQSKEAILTRQRQQLDTLRQEAEKVRLTIGIDPTAEDRLRHIEQAVDSVNKQTDIAIKTNESYVKALQDVRDAEEKRLFTLEQANSRELETITAKSKLIDLTATQNEQTVNAIRLAGELAAQQKIQSETARLGNGGVLSPERQKAIRDEIQKTTDLQVANAEKQIAKSREFSTGWEQAYKQYVENASNAADQAKTYFDTFTKGFEDAIVNFVKTGKLSFKDLANSIIADFVRIQAKQIALGLFSGGGTGGGVGSFFSWLTGKAVGGPVSANTPYLVGENGPELFVPRSSGNIVPNNQLGQGGAQAATTNVVYNINAVDAMSFRQMLAREPEYLYAVTQKGASSIPGGRR